MRRALALSFALSVVPAFAAPPPMASLKLPAGFHIAVWTDQVPDAREMALGAKNTVFVGSRDAGKVYAVSYAADGNVEKVRTVASGLQLPVGVAFHDGDLYVSAVSRIYVLRNIENHLDAPPKPGLVMDRLPAETAHGWKFIAFGPDNKLYVPVGAPCNICDRGDEGFAQLLRMNPDGSGVETVAKGVRNTVGFDWRPRDKSLWFTDNGRDMLGDDRDPAADNPLNLETDRLLGPLFDRAETGHFGGDVRGVPFIDFADFIDLDLERLCDQLHAGAAPHFRHGAGLKDHGHCVHGQAEAHGVP